MTTWGVALAGAAVAGVLGARVPTLIARIPEPLTQPLTESAKEPYADVAASPHLGRWTALVSAVAAGAVALVLGPDRALVGWLPSIPVLVLLAVVDWRTRLLPRLVVLPVTGALLVLLLAEYAIWHDTRVLVRALVAMLMARSVFWLLWFIRRAGMGFGDVRLAALIGLLLGRLGWQQWLLGLYGALIIFVLWGVGRALALRSPAALRQALPFGPFLALGALAGALLGPAFS
ncbi:MAG: prepilin peptidase [Nocardioides sp.]|uniref:prepilin peptidase n=1 Tax=Nocardioides sp. TaxID=35761 RepID=UPI0039E692FE